MQWPAAPPPHLAATPAENQIAKPPGPMTSDGFGQDAAVDQDALMSLVPMDRSQLYDLAEMLLSEMIPGWDDADDEDDEDDEEEEWLEADDDLLPRATDVVLDASYHACILEAERYLVECEGLDADGAVIADLKEYLHAARVYAAAAATAHERQRTPGQP